MTTAIRRRRPAPQQVPPIRRLPRLQPGAPLPPPPPLEQQLAALEAEVRGWGREQLL